MPSHPPIRGNRSPEDLLPLTHIVYHVLLSLAAAPRHGYGIIKDVATRTRGSVEIEAGTLYAAIRRMREDGLIEEVSGLEGSDSRRRYYAVTDFGRSTALAESQRLEAMLKLAREVNILPAKSRAEA